MWQETAAFLVYSVCDPGVKTDAPARESRADAPVAFAGWTLIGNFDCGVGHPGAMPTFPAIPRPEGGGSCTLIVEPVPSWVLSLPGDCRYEVTLQRPSGEQEVRDLSFQVRK